MSEANDQATLSCTDLDIDVAGQVLVRALGFSAQPGTMTCLLGRNGAGKTLTLHTLCGLRPSARGEIRIGRKRLEDWPRRDLARQLGLVTQLTEDPFPSTVIETTLIGRHPHIGFWQWENDQDREFAAAALAAVGMEGFGARDIATLSGGERRRVAIATLLAQDPQLMVLDEPVNHLDPHHQLDTLRLLRAKADAGRTIVVSLHDAGLAARFCDQALLLFGNGDWLCGPTAQTLTAPNISRLYGVPVQELAWPGGRTFVAV